MNTSVTSATRLDELPAGLDNTRAPSSIPRFLSSSPHPGQAGGQLLLLPGFTIPSLLRNLGQGLHSYIEGIFCLSNITKVQRVTRRRVASDKDTGCRDICRENSWLTLLLNSHCRMQGSSRDSWESCLF